MNFEEKIVNLKNNWEGLKFKRLHFRRKNFRKIIFNAKNLPENKKKLQLNPSKILIVPKNKVGYRLPRTGDLRIVIEGIFSMVDFEGKNRNFKRFFFGLEFLI